MAGSSGGLKGKPSAPGADPDGVRVSNLPGVRTGVWLVSIGLVAAAAVLLALLRSEDDSAPDRDATAQPPAAAIAPVRERIEPVPAPRPAAAAPVEIAAEPAPPPAPAEPEPARAPEAPALPEPPEREDPIVGYGPPGTGIQAFPPPGTSPPLRGLVVPEDFELPEGYVRHHQVTDDGQDLAPILMFHPDYEEWAGADGKPVEVPADRVVPPELAPPGMPIQWLEVPGQAAPERP
jgi:hypothetical protein